MIVGLSRKITCLGWSRFLCNRTVSASAKFEMIIAAGRRESLSHRPVLILRLQYQFSAMSTFFGLDCKHSLIDKPFNGV